MSIEPSATTAAPANSGAARRVSATNPKPRLPMSGPLTASELWRAVKEERVMTLYHPQVDLVSGRTVAVEALARIIDEQGKLIAPDRFIAEADDSGVIVPLGRAVLQQACAALAQWRNEELALARVCVNLSALQLSLDQTLARFAERTAEAHGLALSDLEFELSESQLVAAPALALATLDELIELGGRLAIDDFRARHKSIVELRAREIHVVKLDPSIVSALPDSPKARLLARHAVTMARNAGLETVAERVESRAQVTFLRELGCGRAQGYVFTRPVPDALVPKFRRFSTRANSAVRERRTAAS